MTERSIDSGTRNTAKHGRLAIIAIEGPCLAGKSTFADRLGQLLQARGKYAVVIPEYVAYLDDPYAIPERPLPSREAMVAEAKFYISLERRRQQDIAEARSRLPHGQGGFLILDRSFFTCLAYSALSGNPISNRMFATYLASAEYVPPDWILFLCIDPESSEYIARKDRRGEGNPRCIGLSCKIEEYGYIYQPTKYEAYFRSEVHRKFPNLVFVDALQTTPDDCLKFFTENGRFPQQDVRDQYTD